MQTKLGGHSLCEVAFATFFHAHYPQQRLQIRLEVF